ncbi:MAG: hypothetical protein CO167_09475, partial [Candidatus Marinimicrobia bacterium CG_4_9_14_3_um_filter_48_9]
EKPEAVAKNGSPGKQGMWQDAIASLKVPVELAAGARQSLAYLIGMYT